MTHKKQQMIEKMRSTLSTVLFREKAACANGNEDFQKDGMRLTLKMANHEAE